MNPFDNVAPRGIGTTEECFYHLVGTVPHLPMLELIADHCGKVDLWVVQAWQRRQYFPEGMQLAKIRSLLDCAGYRVSELNALDGDVRQLAMMVGMSMVELDEAKKLAGSKSPTAQGVWRIVLRGGGTTTSNRTAIKTFVKNKSRRKLLTDLTSDLSDKLDALFDEYAPRPAPVETSPAPATLDPALPEAFATLAATLISLGYALQRTEGGPEAIRAATKNGQDIAQLIALLEALM